MDGFVRCCRGADRACLLLNPRFYYGSTGSEPIGNHPGLHICVGSGKGPSNPDPDGVKDLEETHIQSIRRLAHGNRRMRNFRFESSEAVSLLTSFALSILFYLSRSFQPRFWRNSDLGGKHL